MRRILLLSDDHFFGEVLGTYLRGDELEILRPATTGEAVREIAGDTAAVLLDLAKRGLGARDIIAMSDRAERAGIPLLVISAQPRSDVTEFAVMVRAADVIGKSERMTAIAGRVRLWIHAPRSVTGETDGFIIPELSLGT